MFVKFIQSKTRVAKVHGKRLARPHFLIPPSVENSLSLAKDERFWGLVYHGDEGGQTSYLKCVHKRQVTDQEGGFYSQNGVILREALKTNMHVL